jgi:hypothetical protein
MGIQRLHGDEVHRDQSLEKRPPPGVNPEAARAHRQPRIASTTSMFARLSTEMNSVRAIWTTC